jgi:hypothetical protein
LSPQFAAPAAAEHDEAKPKNAASIGAQFPKKACKDCTDPARPARAGRAGFHLVLQVVWAKKLAGNRRAAGTRRALARL